jgi:hypothetical protein
VALLSSLSLTDGESKFVIYARNNSQLAVSLFKKVKDVTASLDQETATPTSGKTRTGPAAAFPVYKNSFLSHLTLLFLLHSFPPNPTPRLQPFLTSRSKRSVLRRRIGPSHKVLSLVVLDYEATPPGRSCLRASLGALCPTLLLKCSISERTCCDIYYIDPAFHRRANLPRSFACCSK